MLNENRICNNASAYLVFGIALIIWVLFTKKQSNSKKIKFYYHEGFLTYRIVQNWKNNKEKILITSTNAQNLQREQNLLKE